MSKNVKRGISISGVIIVVLGIIFILTLLNGLFFSSQLKRSIYDDAFIINKLGQIRGSIQRYAKLKLVNDQKYKIIAQKTETYRQILNKLITKRNIPQKDYNKFITDYHKIDLCWNTLQQSKTKESIIKSSEQCWNITNYITTEYQHISEFKTKKLMQRIIFSTVLAAVLILAMIIFTYMLIKKGLEKDKIIDPLTKLYNRRYFIDTMKYYTDIYKRYKRPFSLIFLDIDNFKQINDIHGHQKGDEILKSVSKILRNNIRNSDMAFRYGGEELVIILPETTLEEAYQVAEKLREEIKKIKIDSKPLTSSFGVGEYNGESIFDFIERVDEAVYAAKKAGKDRTIISTV